ncbi:MAG: glycosyltransferase family 4 protein [Crocinitomicaceae bacterium]|nr:glycosyltransferase family 4 protein [Crocinitomicaceae bacterium]
MKVLYITSKPAYPKLDGGCVASVKFIETLLLADVRVKYLTIGTTKHPFDRLAFPSKLESWIQPESRFIDTAVRPIKAVRYLFNRKSYNIDRFYNKSFDELILSTLEDGNFDTIILDSLYSTPYLASIRKNYTGKVILRTHNVEFNIWAGRAENETNPLKKKYLKRLAKDLKRYEIDTLNAVDGIMTLTEEDKDDFLKLGVQIKSTLIPVAIDLKKVQHDYSATSLFHLGSMNWLPNIEAVNRLIGLMPKLKKEIPDVIFHITGIHAETEFQNQPDQGIVVDGFIEDLPEYTSQMGIMVSPITTGSGIRIKILEMMACGVPIITTKLGAQGINPTGNLIIADTDEEIIHAIVDLIADENKRKMLGENAISYINLHHHPITISKKIIEFIASI